MKKTLELVVTVIVEFVIIVGMILLIAIAFGLEEKVDPHKLKDLDAILEMDSSDPEKYPEVKKGFSKIIEDELGIVPQKVAFMLYALHSASDFQVTVYYKYESEWYWFKLSSQSSLLSRHNLTDRLIKIASSG